jgi:hypothetical protein
VRHERALSELFGHVLGLGDRPPRSTPPRTNSSARPARSRAKRLVEARRRLEDELAVERRANADYDAYRARGVMKHGRRFGGAPKPYQPPDTPAGKINLADLDPRNVKTLRGWVQGYNAQAGARAPRRACPAPACARGTCSPGSRQASQRGGAGRARQASGSGQLVLAERGRRRLR